MGEFSKPYHEWLTRPDQSHKKLTQPRGKFLDSDPSLTISEPPNQVCQTLAVKSFVLFLLSHNDGRN